MTATTKTYFACCLLLLVLEVTLFLLGGWGAERKVIQLGERYFWVVASTLLLSVSILPILMAFSVTGGGLGCIQDSIALPELLKRTLAYLFAAGILLVGVGFYVRGRAAGDDYDIVWSRARWVGFTGVVLLILPLLFQLYGFCRHAWLQRGRTRGEQTLTVGEGENMKAARLYALGGLLLMLWVLLRAFWPEFPWWGWPWQEERVLGMSAALAGLFTWPIGAALAATALFLSVLQPLVAVHGRIKMTGAVFYFVGTGLFLGALQADLLRERAWEVPIRWPTATGLTLVLAVLLLNMSGMLRKQRASASDGAALRESL